VIVVAPGNIATSIWDKQTDDIIEKYRNTDYYQLLKNQMSNIGSDVVTKAMSVEEFSNAFFSVFEDTRPADRYTIIKSKNNKIPFSKAKVRIMRS